MLQVKATEAKAKFAELLRTVERGETVVITRHGKKSRTSHPPPTKNVPNEKQPSNDSSSNANLGEKLA